MAKGSIAKKKGPSIHSRAARRATSPSIDTDKSLKNAKPPPESLNSRPAVLAAHRGGGVAKKTKRGRKANLSSKAKRRQEKGLDKAEAVMEKTEKKLQRSKGQAKTIQSRKKTWDEINKQLLSNRGDGEKGKEEVDLAGKFYEDGEEDTDEEMEPIEDEADEADAAIEPSSGPLPPPNDDEEEIL